MKKYFLWRDKGGRGGGESVRFRQRFLALAKGYNLFMIFLKQKGTHVMQ